MNPEAELRRIERELRIALSEAWAVGFNWYLNKNLRLLVDYETTRFEGGAATGDREDEKIVFSRFQIAF